MTWTKRINFTAWPIGQGLFTQADIWIGTKYLRLVYDCGTCCPSPQLTAVPFESIRDRRIDLLVISHFHWDHISRIPELLKHAGEIREVWVPYLAPEQRLLFAFSTVVGGLMTGNSSSEIAEVSSLVAGGRDWFESHGCLVREIGGPGPGEESPNLPPERDHPPEEDKDSDSAPPTSLNLTKIQRLFDAFKVGSRFQAYSAFIEAKSAARGYFEAPVELLTWIRPITDTETKNMMREMEKWLASIGLSAKPLDLFSGGNGRIDKKDLLAFIEAMAKKANRAQLRRIYLALNSDLNAGSLSLMACPTKLSAHYRFFTHDGWYNHQLLLQVDDALSILWTGDEPAKVLDQFLQEAESRLKDVVRIACIHQFPHHGSASSISSNWLDEIGGGYHHYFPISVMSAGRTNNFGHPSPEALWRCSSITVSEGNPPFEASFEWR